MIEPTTIRDAARERISHVSADPRVNAAGFCSGCGYDLAGLPAPDGMVTCPECGQRAPLGRAVVGIIAEVHATDDQGRTSREWVAAPDRGQIEADVNARGLILNGITIRTGQEAFDRYARGEVRMIGKVDIGKSAREAGPVCCRCGYSLEGLSVRDGALRCPECDALNATFTFRSLPRFEEMRPAPLSKGDYVLLALFVVCAIVPPLLILSGMIALLTLGATKGRVGMPAVTCHLAMLAMVITLAIAWR